MQHKDTFVSLSVFLCLFSVFHVFMFTYSISIFAQGLRGDPSRPRVFISHKKDRKNYCIFYLLRVKVAIIGVDAIDI